MIDYDLPQFLQEHGYTKLVSNGNAEMNSDYLFAEGTIPILLVAHVDTVNHTLDVAQNFLYDLEKQVIANIGEGVLGADDRAGIAAIMEVLSTTSLKPHVLFLNYEEDACVGAGKAIKELEFPTDIRYIIEIDRRGNGQAVFYHLDSHEFEDYVQSFGFQKDMGSLTDISVLMPFLGCAGVNLSAGFYREHSLGEFFVIPHWKNTVEKLTEMLRNPPSKKFEYATSLRLTCRYLRFISEDIMEVLNPKLEQYYTDEERAELAEERRKLEELTRLAIEKAKERAEKRAKKKADKERKKAESSEVSAG